MNYLRKIIWLVIAAIFLASVIIGFGIIFSVKNVNVTLRSYSYGAEMTEDEEQRANAEIKAIKDTLFDKCGGKLMGLVDEKDIAECFNDSGYVLSSYEKVYPCTLNITVAERIETFFVSDDDGTFSAYDGSGTLMRSGVKAGEVVEPAIVVSGTTTAKHIKDVAEVSKIFAEKFSALRSVVKEIKVRTSNAYAGYMEFVFRSGITLHIADYSNLTASKMQAAHNLFIMLTGEQKLSGTIVVNLRSDGTAAAYYSY